ncbi:MAG: GNAT family N-acetyltransferase [Lachnospiraceae bacterium]|nr:GNAT family N-acetyltransferase [Lachnospiraceae bacterium]
MRFLNTDFLRNQQIKLELERVAEGDLAKKWVPAYYFFICTPGGKRMGKCCLRVGNNENTYYGGHIGYEIDEPYRGNHYAAKACELLFSLAKRHEMSYVFITCNPDNIASRKTCEYLKGNLLEIAELPKNNDMRMSKGETEKCIFRFEL